MAKRSFPRKDSEVHCTPKGIDLSDRPNNWAMWSQKKDCVMDIETMLWEKELWEKVPRTSVEKELWLFKGKFLDTEAMLWAGTTGEKIIAAPEMMKMKVGNIDAAELVSPGVGLVDATIFNNIPDGLQVTNFSERDYVTWIVILEKCGGDETARNLAVHMCNAWLATRTA
jgi:hypothetical protein